MIELTQLPCTTRWKATAIETDIQCSMQLHKEVVWCIGLLSLDIGWAAIICLSISSFLLFALC